MSAAMKCWCGGQLAQSARCGLGCSLGDRADAPSLPARCGWCAPPLRRGVLISFCRTSTARDCRRLRADRSVGADHMLPARDAGRRVPGSTRAPTTTSPALAADLLAAARADAARAVERAPLSRSLPAPGPATRQVWRCERCELSAREFTCSRPLARPGQCSASPSLERPLTRLRHRSQRARSTSAPAREDRPSLRVKSLETLLGAGTGCSRRGTDRVPIRAG